MKRKFLYGFLSGVLLNVFYSPLLFASALEDFGPWIGAWKGRVGEAGPEYELAIWVSQYGNLNSLLYFDGCMADMELVKNAPYWKQKYPVTYLSPTGRKESTYKIFSLTETSGKNRDLYQLDNSKCTRPPQSSFFYLLAGDDINHRLLIHSTTEFIYSDPLTRTKVSKKMAKAIQNLQLYDTKGTSVRSAAVLCDAKSDFIDQSDISTPDKKSCYLSVDTPVPLETIPLSAWEKNYADLGPMYYYIFHKNFNKAKDTPQYVKGFIDFIRQYSALCGNQLPGPKTLLVRKLTNEVTTRHGYTYTKSEKTFSYTIQNKYLATYQAAEKYFNNTIRLNIGMPFYTATAGAFISRQKDCQSKNIYRMLDNYHEGISGYLQ